jgi:hypothetical protein
MQGLCDESDCNNNGVGDICELPDCNINGVPDDCDISSGFSLDQDNNMIPDECQVDCNGNLIPDEYEIAQGLITDCNSNGIPDDCDWVYLGDCDDDGLPDGCEEDVNEDVVPDDCQCSADFSGDGQVAVHDIITLIAAWGENTIPHSDPVPEDLNVDMEVDIQDLLILIAAWGPCSEYTLPDIEGACCLQILCVEMHEVSCSIINGIYMGDGTMCNEIDCN